MIFIKSNIGLISSCHIDTSTSVGESASTNSEKNRESALEMRRIAMETFGESKKRKRGEEEENEKSSKKIP